MENHINTSNINYELIVKAITNIKSFVNENGYQFKDTSGFDSITEKSFNEGYVSLTQRKRKKMAAFIWKVLNHPTLRNVNKFFHFIMKTVLKSEARIRVVVSDKENAIQEKRKVYKEALAKVKAAYSDYKTEKGDFYKDQITVREYLKKKATV